MPSTLTQLVEELASGRLKVVDLTQPLGPETPVIGLPPMFGASPGVTIDVISQYDERGPAWYWNTLRFGEHTGTHFDAPIHWITGRNLKHNTCDTIPARRFIGPACVIDVTADVDEQSRFPARLLAHRGVGARARPHSAPRVGAAAHRVEQAHGIRTRFSALRRVRPTGRTVRASTRRRRGCSRSIATCSASASRRSGPTRGRRRRSRRRFPITRSCTGRGSSASRVCATSINCRRPAPSSLRRRSKSSTAAAARCASSPSRRRSSNPLPPQPQRSLPGPSARTKGGRHGQARTPIESRSSTPTTTHTATWTIWSRAICPCSSGR